MVPSDLNKSSDYSHTDFILFGFPEVTKLRPLLALPFSLIYAVILSSNSAVMMVIVLEKSLHMPMYILIFSLLASSVVYNTAIVPKMILQLFGLDQITLAGCVWQIFIVYSGVMAESVVLLLMAVDRYLAIGQPLHYHAIIARQFLALATVNGLIRLCFFVLPLVIMVAQVQYCRSKVIYHFFCENMMLFRIACGGNNAQIIGLMVRLSLTLCDIAIIFIAYLKVLQSVQKIAVGTARNKALHMCGTHLAVITILYSLGFVMSILYLPGMSASYHLQNILSALYFLFPASVNPFIYGFRMEKIKHSLLNHWRKKNWSSIEDKRQ
ncbi:olfactory receptor 52K2-like [Gastrophryne carolinensis]